MGRKPNYKFERMERQRAKAAKKATRQEANREKAEKRKADDEGISQTDVPGELLASEKGGDGPDQ